MAVNSGFLDDLETPEAKEKISAWLEEKGKGKRTINYKLRDWLFRPSAFIGASRFRLYGKTGITVD